MNTTPTKPHTPFIDGSVSTTSSIPAHLIASHVKNLKNANKPAVAGPSKLPHTAISLARQKEAALLKEKARLAKERTDALLEEAQAAKEAARLAAEKARIANKKSREAAEKERKIQEEAARRETTPVARILDRTRDKAIEASPRRQSGTSTAPTTPLPPKSPTQTPTPATVTPAKRPRGRPPKNPVTTPVAKPVVSTTSTHVTASPAKTPVKPKRKHTAVDKSWTPEPKPKKPKHTPTAPPSTPLTGKKAVHFSSDDSSSEELSPSPKPKVKKTPKKPDKTVTKVTTPKAPISKAATKVTKPKVPISKAAAAGKAVRQARAKRVTAEYVTEEEYQRLMEEKRRKLQGDPTKLGSTRGGKRYLKE